MFGLGKKTLFKRLFFLSSLANVFLTGLVFYLYFFADPVHLYIQNDAPQEIACDNVNLVYCFEQLNFEQLAARLNEKRPLSSSYTERDLILGYLVSERYFNIEAALGRKVYPEKRLLLEGGRVLNLYSQLTEEDFRCIGKYFAQEKWPLTSEGLFLAMQKDRDYKDPFLVQSFCLTPEFLTVEALFAQAKTLIKRKVLIDLMMEGNWVFLHDFLSNQCSELNDKTRRLFLSESLQLGSSTAAKLLLATDLSYAEKELSKEQILQLFRVLSDQTAEAALFAQHLISGNKNSEVSETAAKWLAQKTSIDPIEPIENRQHVKNTLYDFHVIQPGESLWAISKKYDISLEKLMKVNHLKNNTIHPGKTLKLSKKATEEH